MQSPRSYDHGKLSRKRPLRPQNSTISLDLQQVSTVLDTLEYPLSNPLGENAQFRTPLVHFPSKVQVPWAHARKFFPNKAELAYYFCFDVCEYYGDESRRRCRRGESRPCDVASTAFPYCTLLRRLSKLKGHLFSMRNSTCHYLCLGNLVSHTASREQT